MTCFGELRQHLVAVLPGRGTARLSGSVANMVRKKAWALARQEWKLHIYRGQPRRHL